MRKLWIGWILVQVLLVGAATAVGAASLSFAPGSQSVSPGSTASVDLVISGLADSGAPSLGAFDLVVSFDASLLSLQSVVFGSGLGDSSLGDVDEGSAPSAAGVNLFSLSFLTPGELDALQSADSFVLATLAFDTLGPGASSLAFTDVVLGDAFGVALPLDASPAGSILVPEPATILLLGLAFAATVASRDGRSRRRSRRRSHSRR